MKKKLICILTVLVLILIMSIPAFAAETNAPQTVPDGHKAYWIIFKTNNNYTCYSSDIPFKAYYLDDTIRLSNGVGYGTVYNKFLYDTYTGAYAWHQTGDTNCGGFYTADITSKNVTVYASNSAIDLYQDNTFKTIVNASFFQLSPLPFRLVTAVMGVHPEQVLQGIAAVLGGCLILLISFLSFRRGWQFLLTELRKA